MRKRRPTQPKIKIKKKKRNTIEIDLFIPQILTKCLLSDPILQNIHGQNLQSLISKILELTLLGLTNSREKISHVHGLKDNIVKGNKRKFPTKVETKWSTNSMQPRRKSQLAHLQKLKG